MYNSNNRIEYLINKIIDVPILEYSNNVSFILFNRKLK